ncbi:MAG: flavodoxin-dependent (E)-4-hydroxy-3-methylbut-2-enyl-diphosphate synthase, partial [Bacteroidota bacterium]
QIPFTQNDSKKTYTITPLQPAKKDIFFGGSKLKAIVIGNYPSKEKASSENACNLLPAGETITPPQTAERKPDLYYCTVKKIVHSHRHENFLANPSVFPEGLPSNVVPLIASTHIEDLKNLAANFFLKASCKDALPDIANIPKQHLQGLIIDTETCLEFDPEPWVAFSQHHEIPLIMRIHFQTSDPDELISHLAIFAGNLLLEKKIHGIWLCAPSAERCIPDVAFGFLQSTGIRITKTEFISCPTCARTSFDLEKVLKEVQTHTSNLPGLKIAVMGCVVNGPGEMADADFGFVGTGAGKLHLYQNGKPVVKNIEPGKAVSALLEILHQNGYINR